MAFIWEFICNIYIYIYILCCTEQNCLVRPSRGLCATGLVRLVAVACAAGLCASNSVEQLACAGGLCATSPWLVVGRLVVRKPLRKLIARRNCLCGLWCVLGLLREWLVPACAEIVRCFFQCDTVYIYIYIYLYIYI